MKSLKLQFHFCSEMEADCYYYCTGKISDLDIQDITDNLFLDDKINEFFKRQL